MNKENKMETVKILVAWRNCLIVWTIGIMVLIAVDRMVGGL